MNSKICFVRLCCFVEWLFSFPIAAMINHQKFCSLEIILMFSLPVLEMRRLMWVLAATIRISAGLCSFLKTTGGPLCLLFQLPEAAHILGSVSLCLPRQQGWILLTLLPWSEFPLATSGSFVLGTIALHWATLTTQDLPSPPFKVS